MALWLALMVAAAPARSVDGGLTEAEIADVFELHAAEFAPCFGPAKPRKKASVKYHFEVENGRVTKFSFLDSAVIEGTGATCVAGTLEKTEFPSRENAPTAVDWTFTAPTSSTREPEVATPEQLAPLDEQLTACYTLAPFNEKTEGTLTLELGVLRSGAIASVTVIDQSKALEQIHLDGCLQSSLMRASLDQAQRPHRVRAGWILATSERRAKMMVVPSEQRREIAPDASSFKKQQGGLDKDVIMSVIKKGNPEIKSCYEFVLQKKETLEGKVSVAWQINSQGQVESASINEDTMGDPTVSACILQRVKSWVFPKPIGGGVVNVTFPWIFKRASD